MAESYKHGVKSYTETMTTCSPRMVSDRGGSGKHCRSANDVVIGESYSIKRPSDDTLRV